MLALGLLFMIVAAAVTAGAIYDGGESATFDVFGQTIGTTIAGVFVAGIATMLVFFLGVYLLMKSLARGRRKRIERKEAKNRQKESVSQIEEERARLRAENEELQARLARDQRPATAGGAAGAAGGAAAAHASTDRHDTPVADRPTNDRTTNDRPMTDRTTNDRPMTDQTRVDQAPVQDTTSGSDRVVDHNTDLTSHEQTATSTSGRHGSEI